jgi:hypothetical protein
MARRADWRSVIRRQSTTAQGDSVSPPYSLGHVKPSSAAGSSGRAAARRRITLRSSGYGLPGPSKINTNLNDALADRASTKRRIRLANPPHRLYRRRHTGNLIVVEVSVSTMVRTAAAFGPHARAILHSPPSTSRLVAQDDSFAGTLHTGPAGPVVSNTPAFHGRANSPADTDQTGPRGLRGAQPLRW